MKKTSMALTATLTLMGTIQLSGCNDSGKSSANAPGINTSPGTHKANTAYSADAALDIRTLPSNADATLKRTFDRYTDYITPNGGVIPLYAQSSISNEKIVRVRNVLGHFLRDYPGSLHGADKSAIANQMAENQARLLLLDGQDDGSNPASGSIEGQPLFNNEIQVEGDAWYTAQNYDHRDATFEEILHLVHDYGIGVDGANASPGAAPAFQTEIRAAQVNAQANSLWGIGATDWIAELSNENSLSQEYLAAVVDSYYGLWGASSEGSTSMNGLYVAKDRAELSTDDPMGAALMDQQFFHPWLSYNARIDADFEGEFSLIINSLKPYTHTSRYLKDITLLGNKNTGARVNQLDNHITGNDGINTVRFSGSLGEYSLVTIDGTTVITDHTANRDGGNTLTNVEKVQFSDQTIDLN